MESCPRRDWTFNLVNTIEQVLICFDWQRSLFSDIIQTSQDHLKVHLSYRFQTKQKCQISVLAVLWTWCWELAFSEDFWTLAKLLWRWKWCCDDGYEMGNCRFQTFWEKNSAAFKSLMFMANFSLFGDISSIWSVFFLSRESFYHHYCHMTECQTMSLVKSPYFFIKSWFSSCVERFRCMYWDSAVFKFHLRLLCAVSSSRWMASHVSQSIN